MIEWGVRLLKPFLVLITRFRLSKGVSALRPCLNVEIESVHRICLLTDSVDRPCFGS